ncbi:MAG TPA: hypothetical protein PKJ99_02760 [Thermoanaerobaculales bacterium]|nr:hypothetical protein [Thermoanaerobaculales bacterium]HPA81429.1 hypothetical protein [Thermoanaerobaculales bacterium]HQL29840.1 hypothetical protein [Thermoanaerobaculales bacterium]HQN95494.1 hypothetical protein [Thermoanaerobaculales bacterium]HQP43938.1 hypothetical protein [Thermoanaerobaculales bacterium]
MRSSGTRIAGRAGAVALALLAVTAAAAAADPRFGIHAGVWTEDGDPLVGAEIVLPLDNPRWAIVPSVEFVPGDGVDRWIVNADGTYELDLDTKADVWVGGGLAVLFTDHERHSDDTNLGANLLAGAGIETSSGLFPYLQAKAVISEDSSLAVALGLRF